MIKVHFLLLFLLMSAASYAQVKQKNLKIDALISNDYVTVLSPIEYYYDGRGWGESTTSVNGKYCFGVGMRLSYVMHQKVSSFLGVMIVDKGYRLHIYGETDHGPYDSRGNHWLFYFSIPVGISVNLSEGSHPYYLISGFSPDIMINQQRSFHRFNASVMIGVGKRFKISESLVLLLEPNIKIPLTDYGNNILWEPDVLNVYRPYLIGINIGLSK